MTAADVARAHYERTSRIQAAAVAEARAQWAKLPTDYYPLQQAYTQEIGPQVLAVLILAQLAEAEESDSYVAAILAELIGQDDPSRQAMIDPAGFAYEAADGRDLDTLLYLPVARTQIALRRGAPPDRALKIGENLLSQIIATETRDASRTADQVALVARPQLTGYVRMLTLPSCARCAVLAGQVYKWNDGFQRHPNCLPAGTVVSGPSVDAATRRRYQGELVVIRTASGQELSITGNHPVLTDRGWLPANRLSEGDNAVRSTLSQGAAPLVVPDVRLMPSLIEQVAGSLGVMRLDGVPSAAEDFHGDGGHGEVDIVLADRLLGDWLQASPTESVQHELLAIGATASATFDRQGAPLEHLQIDDASSGRLVRGGHLGGSLLGGHLGGTDSPSHGPVARLHSGGLQPTAHDLAAHSVLASQGVLTGPGSVGGHQFLAGEHDLTARWDAPAGPLTVESRGAYAARGQDLLLRLTGQVELDRIVELRRIEWVGHVFNLSSSEGWYSASNLIVSNCDCIHIPATEDTLDDLRTDPRAAVLSDNVVGLSKTERQAIEDGADVGQVVNSRRGMYTAGGRKYTTEGTTRRGFAAAMFRQQTGRRMRARLRPEQIYREANGNRMEALRLLKLHGYIV